MESILILVSLLPELQVNLMHIDWPEWLCKTYRRGAGKLAHDGSAGTWLTDRCLIRLERSVDASGQSRRLRLSFG